MVPLYSIDSLSVLEEKVRNNQTLNAHPQFFIVLICGFYLGETLCRNFNDSFWVYTDNLLTTKVVVKGNTEPISLYPFKIISSLLNNHIKNLSLVVFLVRHLSNYGLPFEYEKKELKFIAQNIGVCKAKLLHK